MAIADLDKIGDEHSGLGVFLTAQQRKVNLPKIFKTGRGTEDLHGVRLSALARAIVQNVDARTDRVNQHLEFEIGWPRCETTKDQPYRCD